LTPADENVERGGGDLGVVSAVLLYPFMVALCAVALCAGGLLLGYVRDPTYTASAELLVGNLSISDPSAIPGAVGAAQSLAAVYARLIDANEVRDQVTGAIEDGSSATVSATPIVESPLIRVTTTSTSEAAAVRSANVAGTSLAAYVNKLKSPGGEVRPIAREYRRAELRYEEKRDAFDHLSERIGASPTASERTALSEANSDLQTAKLKRNALIGLYQRGQNIRVSQPNLNLFRRATAATSDRSSTMQITGVIGLLAGLALGVALAMFRARRWA
jgi:capsular polysaccharide biosynthesis protein